MDASKDYYAVLGVLPSIEPTALKAVYLALVKKYHPDVYKGSKADAERITKELNQAYGVLGDQAKRAEYDALRNSQTSQGGDFGQEASGDDTETQDNDLARDWKFVVEYHPEAEVLRKELRLISKSLSMLFQYVILFEKASERSTEIADLLKSEYMKRYFGSNKKIQHFAYQMLRDNRRDVALEINNVIRVLGTPADENIDTFLLKLIGKFSIKRSFDIVDIKIINYHWKGNTKIFYIELKNGEIIGTVDNKNYYIFEGNHQFFKNSNINSIHKYFSSTNKEEIIQEFSNTIDIKKIHYFLEK